MPLLAVSFFFEMLKHYTLLETFRYDTVTQDFKIFLLVIVIIKVMNKSTFILGHVALLRFHQ